MSKYLVIVLILILRSAAPGQSWGPFNGLDSTIVTLSDVNGFMYAGGDFNSYYGHPLSPHVAYYTGRAWQGMGAGFNNTVYALAGYSTKVFAGGAFTASGGTGVAYAAQWDGSNWLPAGLVLNGVVRCFATYKGNLYAGGSFVAPRSVVGIARWDGEEWVSVGGGVDNGVYAMAVYHNALYVAGELSTAGTTSASFIAKWDGTTWSHLGTDEANGVDAPVSVLGVYNDQLYVGGDFYNAAGIPANHVARWNDVAWSPVSFGVDGTVSSFAVFDSSLFIGGQFATAGPLIVNNIVRWDGNVLAPVGIGVAGPANALLGDTTDLFVGGKFKTAGTVDVNNFARWGTNANTMAMTVFANWDKDGVLGTNTDRVAKSWHLAIYKDSVSGSTLVTSGNATRLTIVPDHPGTYITVEADSGEHWSRLNGGHYLSDTITVALNTTVMDSFINFHDNLRFPVSLTSGWNLLGYPINGASQIVKDLYPGALTKAFNYDHTHGYTLTSTVTNGRGFWLKHGPPAIDTLVGTEISSITIPVTPGWNLIGSITRSVSVGSVIQVPPGNTLTPYYEYIGSYHIADSIKPGKGYWIKVKLAGQLTLQYSVFEKQDYNTQVSINRFGSLTLTDAAGKSGDLFFGRTDEGTHDALYYELPPKSPEGTFDIRFANGAMATLFEANKSEDESSPVQISGAAYPVTLRWSLPQNTGGEYRLISGSTGKTIADLKRSGSLILRNEVSDLRIRMTGKIPLPKSFALYQNYPNPFNPVTSIAFDLPVKAEVSLTVYNQLGQVTATLFDHELMEAGSHRAVWNAAAVASGIYYYRIVSAPTELHSTTFHDVKKLALIK